jgi:predicted site-specific integrase-resolvase
MPKEKEIKLRTVAEMLDIPRTTLGTYCNKGKVPGARKIKHPNGDYWVIPESSIPLIPKPKMGRPKKNP